MVTLLVLLFLAPVVKEVSLASLAAVLIMVAWNMGAVRLNILITTVRSLFTGILHFGERPRLPMKTMSTNLFRAP